MQFTLCRILSIYAGPLSLTPLPAATGASRDSCCSHERDKRDTIQGVPGGMCQTSGGC